MKRRGWQQVRIRTGSQDASEAQKQPREAADSKRVGRVSRDQRLRRD